LSTPLAVQVGEYTRWSGDRSAYEVAAIEDLVAEFIELDGQDQIGGGYRGMTTM
jgi:hypothetical protein